MAREIATTVGPRLSLRWVLKNWEQIARYLCDPPRKRKRQSLS